MLCSFCGDSGVYHHKDAFMTCPHCQGQRNFMDDLELKIAELVLDGEIEEARDLNVIYRLLKDCPILAYLEAKHQKRNSKLVERMRIVFNIKRLE